MRERAGFVEVCGALLGEGRRVRFRAEGRSMEPAIREGDVLTVAPLAGEVRRGDVLLYQAGQRLLAHRVVGRVRGADGLLRVRGDAPGWEEEHVPLADVLGRIEGIERDGRPVSPPGPLARRAARLARRARSRLRRRV
jgi:phage repressor protein C with HTH and peptisase S24 domain